MIRLLLQADWRPLRALVMAIGLAVSILLAPSAGLVAAESGRFVPGWLLVPFRRGIDAQAMAPSLCARVADEVPEIRLTGIDPPGQRTAGMATLASDPRVGMVEPDPVRTVHLPARGPAGPNQRLTPRTGGDQNAEQAGAGGGNRCWGLHPDRPPGALGALLFPGEVARVIGRPIQADT